MVIHLYLGLALILSLSRGFHQTPVIDTASYVNIMAIYKSSLMNLMSDSSSNCTICKSAVKAVEVLMSFKVDENLIFKLVVDICIDLHFQTPRVCIGLADLFKMEVFTVLRKAKIIPEEACKLLLPDDCSESPDPPLTWNITFPDIPKPPVMPIPSPPPGAPTLRVLHLSDIHLDLLYTPASDANCNEPVCCHDNLSKKGTSRAGKWGDFGNCDTPLILLENLLMYISQKQQIDYVILTGDLPAHDIWNQTRQDQLKVLKVVFKLLLQYFPKTPIYPSLGNHEGNPVNSFPPPFIQGNMSINWLYDTLAQTWTTWLPNSTLNSIKLGAYYSVLVEPKFRIISINMNYCNNINFWLFINSTDPANELTWLVDELQKAENNKEKVHIIGHIPPGTSDCMKTWSWNYYRIINRYESTITAQFFGHTHYDEIELFYDEQGLKRPISIAYIGPSVTPYSKLNPGFRIYTIDGDYQGSSRIVLDHETYVMNLTEANQSDNPKWFKEYSAQEAYNMSCLHPCHWDNLLMSMRTNDSIFNKYYTYYYKSNAPDSCDEKCKENLLCKMRSGRSFDPDMCKPLKR